ncbi:31139_t:CDS:2, partial [Gigaspora margarita]
DLRDEALQQLYQLHPDLNGQSIWFFSTLKKSAEGCILYEKLENHVYVYNMITQSPSYNSVCIGQIIKGDNHVSYFKNAEIITLVFIKKALATIICNNAEFASITLIGNEEFLRLIFFDKKNMQKELQLKQAYHKYREFIECSILVNEFKINDFILKNNNINIRISTMDDIVSIM